MIRAMDIWLPAYLRQQPRERQETHLILTVCDHFEPFHDTDQLGAMKAMRDWHEGWTAMVSQYRDSGGNAPRHTFFYPIEQYEPQVVDSLARLCRQTGSEAEVHLHHDGDTPEGLAQALREGTRQFAGHGLLSQDAQGTLRFGFIHGNWALDNSDPRGCNCGVNNELGILRREGCYGDFTMPSAPHRTQTRTVNSIYYAEDTAAPKSHDVGVPLRVNGAVALREKNDHLLMVQGPLALNWKRRKWGLIPKVENGELSGANPPTVMRLELWERFCPSVRGGPPWVFVKLHTHGGISRNYDMLLGKPMHQFHLRLREWASSIPGMSFHYATAREMANMIHAAEDGKTGSPEDYRHYLFRSNASVAA
jgi:hypothetical protein